MSQAWISSRRVSRTKACASVLACEMCTLSRLSFGYSKCSRRCPRTLRRTRSRGRVTIWPRQRGPHSSSCDRKWIVKFMSLIFRTSSWGHCPSISRKVSINESFPASVELDSKNLRRWRDSRCGALKGNSGDTKAGENGSGHMHSPCLLLPRLRKIDFEVCKV